MQVNTKKPAGLQAKIFLIISATVVGSVMVAAFFLVGHVLWMTKQIDEVTWQLPATIYAEPPTLSPGKTASKTWLIQYLKRLNYVETDSTRVEPGEYAYAKNGLIFCSRPLTDEPAHPVLVNFNGNRIQSIVDLAHNSRVDQFTMEPTPLATLFGSEWEKRTLVKLEQLPPHVIDAVIAIEDRRFYRHSGVDLFSIGRAIINNLSGDGPFQGASTITQQLVKNLYLTPEKTLRRKISEAMMAVLMEAKYSKEQILEFYLNEVYLGQRGAVSIKGIGEASQFYFRKDARHLTVEEAAMIAGLIQAPSRYDPHEHPEKARLRRNSVLMAMRENGFLSPDETERYLNAELEVREPVSRLNRAPYFMTYVKRQLRDQFSKRALHEDDYTIISTLDYDMQMAAQEAIAEGLERIDRIRGLRRRVQGSLIAIEPSTGKIRAFVGGRDFGGSQFDRLTQAKRQPGSSFKPFVYAAALETAFQTRNTYFTTSSLVADQPWSMQLDRAVWAPQNYNGAYNGVVSVRTALAKSMNVATAKIGQQVGFNQIYQLAQKMGFQNVKPYPSIVLGAFEVSPYQLIRAYTAFANGGKIVELQAISRVVNSEGDLIRQRQLQQFQVLHPETAYLVTDMLKTVMRSGTAASVQRWGIRKAIAGKTGTTNDQKDAWFVGYTPDLICLVWVGYDNNKPIGMTGAQAALPIWARFMKNIESRISSRDFSRPLGIVEKTIDPYTGKLATYWCPNAVTELFIKGTEPLSECSDSDHYLPIDYFVGPEPRIDQYDSGYYRTEYDYGNIIYDDQRYVFTNYDAPPEDGYYTSDENWNEETPETVDYSELSFPRELQEHESEEKSPSDMNPSQPDTDAPLEEDEGLSVINDSEAPDYQEEPEELTNPDFIETEPPPDRPSPVYMAPKTKPKKRVYTNKDIPEADTFTEDDDEPPNR